MTNNGTFNEERLKKYRLEKTQQVMKDLNLDAIVATTFDNVRYISNIRPYFTPVYYVNAYVVVLISNGLPIIQGPVVEGAPMGLSPTVKGWEGYPMIPVPAIAHKWATMLATILRDNSITSGNVGFDDMSFLSYIEVSHLLPRIKSVPVFDAMLNARTIKNEDEIALLRKAAEIVDIGAEAGLDAIKPGAAEREVVAKMAAAMYQAGSEAEPWAGSFSSGKKALDSVFATDRVLQDGDIGVFDIGSIYEGYLGDIARTGAVGNVSHESREIYTAAYDALKAGTEEVRPGAMSSEVDGRIRETLRDAKCNVPPLSTGHGIGVGAPEIPWITPREKGIIDFKLQAGMVLCLEPRTSRDGVSVGGCEDTILVTESGHEVLNKCRKEEHLLV
jgi:Xaa-Pro aminopeptidase